jgi:hypothetical protein
MHTSRSYGPRRWSRWEFGLPTGIPIRSRVVGHSSRSCLWTHFRQDDPSLALSARSAVCPVQDFSRPFGTGSVPSKQTIQRPPHRLGEFRSDPAHVLRGDHSAPHTIDRRIATQASARARRCPGRRSSNLALGSRWVNDEQFIPSWRSWLRAPAGAVSSQGSRRAPGRSRTRNLVGRSHPLCPVELQGRPPMIARGLAASGGGRRACVLWSGGGRRRRMALRALRSPRSVARPVPDWMLLVAVAQLVRAPGRGPGGRGFKSPRSPQSTSGPAVRTGRCRTTTFGRSFPGARRCPRPPRRIAG